MFDILLAAVLLTTPTAWDEAHDLERIQPALLQLAIGLEVLDPREEQYLQGLSRDPAGDLKALRRRFEVLRFAPRLEESQRLPPRKLVEDFLDANRAYRKDLVARLEVDTINAESLRTAIHEVDQLYQVWITVRDCQSAFYYVSVRRQSLAHLRDLIGTDAFARGELPPHVPYWHFPRLR